MYRAPPELVSSKEPSLRLIQQGNPPLGSLPTDRGLVHGENSWTGELRKRLIEFTVKAEYAYDYGMPQRLARIDHLLGATASRKAFLGRHKFYHFRVWYRDQLSHYVKEILLDRARGKGPTFRDKFLNAWSTPTPRADKTGRWRYTAR